MHLIQNVNCEHRLILKLQYMYSLFKLTYSLVGSTCINTSKMYIQQNTTFDKKNNDCCFEKQLN